MSTDILAIRKFKNLIEKIVASDGAYPEEPASFIALLKNEREDLIRACTEELMGCPTNDEMNLLLRKHFTVLRYCHTLAIERSNEELTTNPKNLFDKLLETIEAISRSFEEIFYLSNNSTSRFSAHSNNSGLALDDEVHPDYRNFKIKVNLSADQIGMIIKAAYHTNLFDSRSLSNLFRVLTPYLSTKRKEKLSYKGIRAASYKAEINDQEAAIACLENMIQFITSY